MDDQGGFADGWDLLEISEQILELLDGSFDFRTVLGISDQNAL